MSFVDNEPRIRGQDSRLTPIPRNAAHRDVGQQQVMIDHDDVGLRGLTPRLEQEAFAVERALRSLTEVGLRRDFIPQLGAWRRGEVAQRSVGRALRPRLNRVELLLYAVLEQRVARRPRVLEPDEAEIVSPPLEQREPNLLIVERFLEKWQILADELLL